jgi:hypothetical protein
MDETPRGLAQYTGREPGEGDGDTSLLPLFVLEEQFKGPFLEQLLEHPVQAEPACLLGYERRKLAGLPQDVVYPAAEGCVDGLIYRRLSSKDFRRLDAYEGVGEGLYQRVRVAVESQGKEGSASEPAFTYLATNKTLLRWPLK